MNSKNAKTKSSKYFTRGKDYAYKDRLRTLPEKYYTSESIYGEELEKIFYKRWLMVGREEQAPKPGDYFLFNIADESIIIVRDSKNNLHAHFNVCRHRGTRMCMEEHGHFEKKSIQCPYHAWTYNLKGELIGAPFMNELKNFDKKDFPLHNAHLHIWEGFIFINLSENPVPFEKEFEPLIGKWSDWHLPELRIAYRIEYNLNCNWKLVLQNYQECYHCPGVHPLLCQWTPFRSASHDCMQGGILGGFMTLEKERGSMTMAGNSAGPPLGNVSGEDLQKIYYYSIYPNVLFTPHPDFILFHIITPKGVGKVQLQCHWLFHPDVIREAKYKDGIRSAVQFWDLTNKQDWQVCEQMQMGVASKRFDRGYYSGMEDILSEIDNETLRSLGHKRKKI